MLADPDMGKVHLLLDRLSDFYWSKKLPEQCVLPDGTGLGRIAYDDMAAFNLAWCYYRPTTLQEHTVAITAAVQLRRVLDVSFGAYKLRDAVMLLKSEAFGAWLSGVKKAMPEDLYRFILQALLYRKTY